MKQEPLKKWWLSHNEESYQPFEAREAAVEEGLDYGGTFWIGQGYQREIDLASYFEASDWIIRVSENDLEEDLDPDDPDLNINPHDISNLEVMVRATIRKWQDNLTKQITAWSITWTIYPERIEPNNQEKLDGSMKEPTP